jgi:hypothetical protein
MAPPPTLTVVTASALLTAVANLAMFGDGPGARFVQTVARVAVFDCECASVNFGGGAVPPSAFCRTNAGCKMEEAVAGPVMSEVTQFPPLRP